MYGQIPVLYQKVKSRKISLEYAIFECRDNHEIAELIKILNEGNIITEDDYKNAMISLSKRGLLEHMTKHIKV